MHEQLLAAVLALPLAFFDATPPGRVLNRFSSDTGGVSLPGRPSSARVRTLKAGQQERMAAGMGPTPTFRALGLLNNSACYPPTSPPARLPAPCGLQPRWTTPLPFILNILLANCASLAGVAVVLCITQVRQASA